jgi:hypothetical protein
MKVGRDHCDARSNRTDYKLATVQALGRSPGIGTGAAAASMAVGPSFTLELIRFDRSVGHVRFK